MLVEFQAPLPFFSMPHLFLAQVIRGNFHQLKMMGSAIRRSPIGGNKVAHFRDIRSGSNIRD
jgi:hypothetical protein